mgnify:CR=1 FL=1
MEQPEQVPANRAPPPPPPPLFIQICKSLRAAHVSLHNPLPASSLGDSLVTRSHRMALSMFQADKDFLALAHHPGRKAMTRAPEMPA